jgi:hypothetical protein
VGVKETQSEGFNDKKHSETTSLVPVIFGYRHLHPHPILLSLVPRDAKSPSPLQGEGKTLYNPILDRKMKQDTP